MELTHYHRQTIWWGDSAGTYAGIGSDRRTISHIFTSQGRMGHARLENVGIMATCIRETDGKRNFATELQAICLEGLLEAITRAISRIKREGRAA